MNSIEFDVTKQLDKLNKLADDMPYIMSKALNDVAFKDIRKSFSKEMQSKMNIKNKNFASDRSFSVSKSDKKDLSIDVFHKKKELGMQQFGGIELPKSKKIAIPLITNLARVGFSKKRALTKSSPYGTKKLLEKERTGAKIKGGVVIKDAKGIYIAKGGNATKVYTFVDKAVHSKQTIDFQKVIEETMNKKFERQLNVHYMRLLKG